MAAEDYDPFVPGPFAVGVRTAQIEDRGRGRVFPCEIWYPAASPPSAGPQPGSRAEQRDALAARGVDAVSTTPPDLRWTPADAPLRPAVTGRADPPPPGTVGEISDISRP